VNHGFDYREQIGTEGDGQTVLDHLAQRYRHSTEAEWRARIEAGQVSLAGRPAACADRLRRGQELVWRRPPWEEPEVPLAFAVLYRDDEVLVVAKPRGLPCLPNGGFLEHTLLHAVRGLHPGVAPLHRLGRGTSGLVLFARTSAARRTLARAWRQGDVDKRYLALVTGVPPQHLSIDEPIGLVPHPRLGHVFGPSPNGRPSLTHVQRLAVRPDGTALVRVQIPTGRPHQIRIHLAFAGYPLAGDPLYAAGGGLRPRPGLPGDAGYRLHAHRLAFPHPATGRRVEVECGPPPELQATTDD
jgi:23S rRNA pseudouridine1911/1915/1917 synthase